MTHHYLDYNATAPLKPEVLEVMRELLAMPLNPSSVHANGRKARGIVEDARRAIGEVVGAFANEVAFTASGTEANNWALAAFPDHVLVASAIEHASVLKPAQHRQAAVIPVTRDGVVDMVALERLLPQQGHFLVSVMIANNETGVIQPVAEIARTVHARGGLLHCDAVQGLGKISVDFNTLGCDLMTLSAHKMGGPVGVAALVAKNTVPLQPLLRGGGQELGRRAGTENVAAIAGFAKAAVSIDLQHMQQLRGWLDAWERNIIDYTQGACEVAGRHVARLPNTSCVSAGCMPSETQLIHLDLAGIAASAGSACTSGKIEPSHVLAAMGMPPGLAAGTLRISGGWATRERDIIALTAAWKALYARKQAQKH